MFLSLQLLHVFRGREFGFVTNQIGYLVETVKDTYRTVSLSPEGAKFLRSCTPDHQLPSLLLITRELFGNELGFKKRACCERYKMLRVAIEKTQQVPVAKRPTRCVMLRAHQHVAS